MILVMKSKRRSFRAKIRVIDNDYYRTEKSELVDLLPICNQMLIKIYAEDMLFHTIVKRGIAIPKAKGCGEYIQEIYPNDRDLSVDRQTVLKGGVII